jgi:hypothetical protein
MTICLLHGFVVLLYERRKEYLIFVKEEKSSWLSEPLSASRDELCFMALIRWLLKKHTRNTYKLLIREFMSFIFFAMHIMNSVLTQVRV